MTNQSNRERVEIHLKTLVDLAKPASLLRLEANKIQHSQAGLFISAFKGRGMEFDESRLYQPGDDIRNIDWRVTARTGKTHSKVFREERERPVFISIDQRLAMQFATRGVFKSVQAAKLAALLAWAANHRGDRVGGQCFSDSYCQELKPQAGQHAVLRFFNLLINTPQKQSTDISLQQVWMRLLQHVKPGSLVYIVSDFRNLNRAVEYPLSRLVKHCQVNLIHLYDPLESHLPTGGRFRLTDGHRELVINTVDKQHLLTYQQRYQQRLRELTALAMRLKLNIFQCSTEDNPLDCLQAWKHSH